ncbi:DNA-binding transcriptional MerR regulator [Rhodococcus sp. 27YEA15]|uniref:MerR family transcriptional regulator n=1 Tax=Rhodococcus sp. 27YEA15 TaxID=3156259 RepID=UPI003C7E28B8
MLKIGELAELAGTTVKSVRYYHSCGLLDEPERQHNGYRVYRVQDLVRLSRIRRMRALGLPVARIRDLLGGRPADVHDALDALDDELSDQMKVIESRRATIASLRHSLDPELPDQFAEVIAEYEAAGAPENMMSQERERLILALTVADDTEYVLSYFLGIHRRVLADDNRTRGIGLITRIATLDDQEPDVNVVEALAEDFCDFLKVVLPEQVDADTSPLVERAGRLLALLEEHQSEHRSPGQETFARAVAARLASFGPSTDEIDSPLSKAEQRPAAGLGSRNRPPAAPS